MPVKPVRRIAAPTGPSLYDLIGEDALSSTWSREELARTESHHPDLIVRRDGSVLAAVENGSLAYSFTSDRAFIDGFEPMFGQLLLRVRRELATAETVRFRLTHNPSRPIVEPVLKRLWFAPTSAWIGFSLAKRTPLPRLAPLSGVKFRDGGPDDLSELVRIDREAFPDTPLPTDVMRRRMKESERVLLATAGGKAAGCVWYRTTDDGNGYIWILAVGSEFRERGIGAALTVRAAKKLFAEGAQRVDLRTEEDNADAIRMYVRLGFRQTHAGRDYSRPTDPRAITRLKKTSAGTLIRFGGWR